MRPLALAATLLASTLASGGRVSRGVSDLGRARAWKEERHAKALFEDRFGPVRVVRRLRQTKVVQRPSFVFVSAVLVVRHGNESGLLKIRSVPGDQDTWRGMELQRRAAAAGLAPRVLAIEALERSPGQTTFGALSELLDGYASMEDMSKLEPVHFKRAGEALSRLHALGIRHGDMHPGQFMVRGQDVKIIDFDSARAIDKDPCEGWEKAPGLECDDFIRLGAWDVAKLSAGTNMTTRAAWDAAVADMGPRIAAHWSMRVDLDAPIAAPGPRRPGPATGAHAARTIGEQRKYAEQRIMRLLYDAHGPVKIVSRIKEKLGPTRGCKTTKLVTLVSFGDNLGVLKILSRSTAMVRFSRRCSVTREIDAHRAVAAAAPGLVPRVINSFVDVDDHVTSGALFTEYLSPDEYVLYENLDPLTPRHLLLAAQAVERFHAVGYRHGDLHFKNILWSESTQSVKIIDLETARPDDDPCHTDSRDDGRCDDAISVTAWDLKVSSADSRQFWDRVAAFLGEYGRYYDLNFLRDSKPLILPARRVAPKVARRRGVVLGAGEARARQQRYVRRFEAVHGSVDIVSHLAGPRAIKLYRRRLEPNGAVYTRSIMLVRHGVLKVATVHGKRDTWPEWEAQAEVHAAAPDLAPRTVGYVAIDDADQPTTTFVGLSERVEGTPLSDLDLLRPRHLSLASAALDRLHRLGFRHGDGHLGNFILGNDGTTIRIIDYEQAVRNASCARDGCADQIFLTKADVEHLRNGTSLSMKEAWRSAGAALGAKRGAHSSLRRFFLDGARKARTSHIK